MKRSMLFVSLFFLFFILIHSSNCQDFGSKLPLYFIQNGGQTDEQVSYYIKGRDKIIYFTPQGITFALTAGVSSQGHETSRLIHTAFSSADRNNGDKAQRSIVKIDFVGAKHVKPMGQQQTEALFSYFRGKPDQWKTGLKTYSSIIYNDLWPGIDLIFSGTVDQLKYTFVLDPRTDPKKIQLAYDGANVSINQVAAMEVSTPAGGFLDGQPFAYQTISGKNVEVRSKYKLEADKESGRFTAGFELGAYDKTLPLWIDPTILIYSGYIGGSGQDEGSAIAVDQSGSAYIVGFTDSSETSFPVTSGPDTSYNGGERDAFVAKVNSDGTALSYAGYIGGNGNDEALGVAVDSSKNVYIAGITTSSEATFPVVAGPDLSFNGGVYDSFVTKIDATGTSLLYAGYIGGAGEDFAESIAINSAGDAYIGGDTTSTEETFPVLVGPDLTYNGAYTDGYIVKVNSTGTALDFAGYIGGSDIDSIEAITVDGSGNAYAVGYTNSDETTFPVTVGPDLLYNGGEDAFVAKVNSSGDSLAYAGYIGGSSNDAAWGVGVDGPGNVYVVGNTSSTESTFPVTIGPNLTHNGSSSDAFIAKVNTTGTAFMYAGYIGGSSTDVATDVVLDNQGNTYIAGYTTSDEDTFPVLGGPDLTYNGGLDAFVAKVNAAGTAVEFAGYIGGSSDDIGSAIVLDPYSISAYVGGHTHSSETSFPVTTGPDIIFSGPSDAFVARVATCYFFDGFEDGDASDWIIQNGTWSVHQGVGSSHELEGTTNANGKATIDSPPFSVSPKRTVSAHVKFATSNARITIAGWKEESDYLKVTLTPETGSVVIKQKRGRNFKSKSFPFTFFTAISYNLQVSYDGQKFTVLLDGQNLGVMNKIGTPTGIFGFSIRSTDGSIAIGSLQDVIIQ